MKLLLTIGILLANTHVFAQAPPIQWQKSLGGSERDYASSVCQTKDGGYIVAGSTASNDGDVSGNHDTTGNTIDYWIVKLNNAGNIQWQRAYGGSRTDVAMCIQQTTDGGYIVAGGTYSNDGDVSGNHDTTGNSSDYWVLKLDSIGNIQWQKCLGGSDFDYATSIEQTFDGGYIIAGNSNSTDGDVTGHKPFIYGPEDYWVVKLDNIGNIQWEKCYGGTATDEANSVQQTTDSGYIVAGQSFSQDGDVTGNHDTIYKGNLYSDFWIVKLNSAGVIKWEKCFGSSDLDFANSIEQTPDRGYIIVGASGANDGDVTGSHGLTDYWIVKIDSTGIIVWEKCLGGSLIDMPEFIRRTNDGGYIITGGTTSDDDDVSGNHATNYDYWVVKVDSIGNLKWQKCLGGTADDYSWSVQQAKDSGYIVAGFSYSDDGDATYNYGDRDYWVVKLGPDISTNNKSEVISNKVEVFPNPSNNILTITTSNFKPQTTFTITDIAGRIITSGWLTGNIKHISISDLEVGIYLLQVGNEMKQTFKIVKE